MSFSVLITGGTGFFGRALLRHHLVAGKSLGLTIMVLSRNPELFLQTYPEFASHESIGFIKGDIQNRNSLPWGHSFSHIIHAATDSTFGPLLTPLQRFAQILEGTMHILDLAIATGARRLLLTSSGGIYGPQPTNLEAIPENWQGSPPLAEKATAYSQAKRAAEHLCTLYRDAYGLETVIARCFAFVGPDMPLDVHFAIGNFIRDALSAEAITVSGDGSQLRTYLDQSDLADWLWTLMLDGHDGETYNVGSDQVISIGELAYLVRDLLAPSKTVRVLGTPQEATGRNSYIPNISKIKTMHGVSITVPLDQSILNTAKAHG